MDASAFLRASQGNREAIDTLRAHRYGNISLYVPAHFFLEVANALRTSVVHGRSVAADAHSVLNSALDLNVEVDLAVDLCAEALKFAFDHGVSVYDASYATLALRREAPLVTADAGLAQATQAAGVAATLILDGPEV